MLSALLGSATTTTTTPASTTTASTLLPSVGSTSTTTSTTVGGSGSAPVSSTTISPTTTLGSTHASTTPTTHAPVSAAVSNDHGVVHQFFIDGGASSSSAHTAQIYLDGPLKVLVILIVAWLLARLVVRISHRLVNGLRLVSPVVKATPRGAARIQTLTGAFTQVLRALIWVIAFLEILNVFSIDLTPFVATATVIGAALGFGAQTLVKDFLSGILLLAEDQYGVGDHIAIGTGTTLTSGTVESVNLRVTRLRGADGGILYVPNGDIRTLSNDTETDSQALVDVVVPYGTDLEAAGRAAQAAARGMFDDEAWAPEFAGEPYFAGVQDATGASGPTIRVMALTRPGQHLRLAREMRLRIIERVRSEGLAWAAAPGAGPAGPGAVTGDDVDGAELTGDAGGQRSGTAPPAAGGVGRTGSDEPRGEDPPLPAAPPSGAGEPAPRAPLAARSGRRVTKARTRSSAAGSAAGSTAGSAPAKEAGGDPPARQASAKAASKRASTKRASTKRASTKQASARRAGGSKAGKKAAAVTKTIARRLAHPADKPDGRDGDPKS